MSARRAVAYGRMCRLERFSALSAQAWPREAIVRLQDGGCGCALIGVNHLAAASLERSEDASAAFSPDQNLIAFRGWLTMPVRHDGCWLRAHRGKHNH